ncbi:N-acetylglucosaminidase [Salinicoccus sp. ID82-1]|uniref:Autolysin n=1 Tax=Salinicoccus cyprini TaxID=2493691 RepID=A0A558AV84_9STAP|nr:MULTISPECIES: N-acetylglucosaminidase [Salinicoccus]MCG1010456.1 N-acetylglucosaminidase [Salinicoccus sp. ID82-1]TVT28170.1 autolysin [Salinicoccus cyprini]
MDKRTKENIPIFILLVVMLVFFLAFLVSETEVFKGSTPVASFEEAVGHHLQNDTTDLELKDGSMLTAKEERVREAMAVDGSPTEFQFLDLTERVDADSREIAALLEGKGILEGMEEAFLEAQSKHGVNVLYLISHAQIETGNGKSQLARGIEVDGTTYYNFFGIGAFDREAVEEGSSYAAEAGWSSPEAAILGGAAFIRKNYLDNQQQTLYAMRWNPQQPGTHLYATDIEWAIKIGHILESHYARIDEKAGQFITEYYQ